MPWVVLYVELTFLGTRIYKICTLALRQGVRVLSHSELYSTIASCTQL